MNAPAHLTATMPPLFRDELADHLIERVRAIAPVLATHAAANEAAGTLVDEVVAMLDELPGIWSMLVPERLGGLGLSASAQARVSAELAKADPAVAWVVQILGGATWLASLAPDAVQDELFADGVPRVCAAFGPPGKAVPVEGGYRVTGRWPYSSGFRLAQWGVWAVVIERPDGSKAGGNFCYIPTADLTLDLSWDTVALQGTGSDTAVAIDIFVPAHRMVTAAAPHGDHAARPRHNGAPSDRWPVPTLVGRTGLGQAIGTAQAMLAAVRTGAMHKPVAGTRWKHQSESAAAVREFGAIAAKIDAAKAIVDTTLADLDAAALAGRALSLEERARSRALGGTAAAMIDEASQQLMSLAGSSAFARGNPLSRYWRDLGIVVRHVQNLPAIGHEVYGRVLLETPENVLDAHLV